VREGFVGASQVKYCYNKKKIICRNRKDKKWKKIL